VNELISEHDVEDVIGLGFAVDAFKQCRTAWPNADLVYNDYLVKDGDGVNPKFLGYAKKLQSLGAPITLLGFQAHFGESLPAISWYWKFLDQTKLETGLPVEITEYDVNTRNDDAQGDYTRDVLTAWFAHPQTKGFTMWGFWEGSHWLPQAAMIRKDWTQRPQAKVWHELVTKTWWTDLTLKADKNGVAKVRGFKGDYEVSSGKLVKQVKLGEPKTVKLGK
jgi:endo-1,4-beta-xylanase